MFENVNDMAFFINIPFRKGAMKIIDVNEAVCKTLEYTREELLRLNPGEIIHRLDASGLTGEVDKLAAGRQSTAEMDFRTKSGRVLTAEVNSWLIRTNGEELILSVVRDISERKRIEKKLNDTNYELKGALDELKRTQEQLVQSEKLAGIGQLAAGVAHEINNPLGYITSNVDTAKKYFDRLSGICTQAQELARLEPELDEEALRDLVRGFSGIINDNKLDYIIKELNEIYDDIGDGLRRINKIVTGLKTFARVEQGEAIEEYDLNAGIRNTLLVVHNELKHHTEVTEILGNIPHITVRGGQINQVLLNLLLNSIHSIRSKNPAHAGLITVRTYCDSVSVYCEIEDNGTGIAEENSSKIFQPFFTTKPVGQGTGLGLSIAYDIIVNKHHGDLRFESTPGEGTKFILGLPVNRGNEAEANKG
jgi:PAS domain S-box-containing protein